MSINSLRSTTGAEKILENGGCARLQGTGQVHNLRTVMAGRLVEEFGAVRDGAALRIGGGVDDPLDARKRDCTGAHRAGFEGT